jgi:hypothetical protein
MSNKQTHTDPLDVLAAAKDSGLPASTDPDILEMQKGLLALQYKKLAKDMAEQDETDRVAKQAQLNGALEMQKGRDRQEALQSACPHMKPNMQPAIAGQRDHQHQYHFICAFCAKEYTQQTLPPWLRIPIEWIGGPDA